MPDKKIVNVSRETIVFKHDDPPTARFSGPMKGSPDDYIDADPDTGRTLADDELHKECMDALMRRGMDVGAMQMFEGLTYQQAHLRAPPYRDILCGRCANIALKKKEPSDAQEAKS